MGVERSPGALGGLFVSKNCLFGVITLTGEGKEVRRVCCMSHLSSLETEKEGEEEDVHQRA